MHQRDRGPQRLSHGRHHRGQRAVALMLALALLLLTAGSAAAQTGGVTGTVEAPGGGLPPAGTQVKLFEPNGWNAVGITNVNPDGTFALAGVPQGLFVVKAVPPLISGFTQSEPTSVSVFGTVVDVGTIELTDPEILGTVTEPDGITAAGAEVKVHAANGQLLQVVGAPAGAFAIGGLPAGTYGLQAWPTTDHPFWRSPYQAVTVNGTTQTLSLTLRAADVWGVVTDPLGNPVPDAEVHAVRVGGRHRRSDDTSRTGTYAIGDLLPGDYVLTAMPPYGRGGLLPSVPVTLTAANNTVVRDLTLVASPKVVTGTVATNTGDPVANALVAAHRLDKAGRATVETEGNGTYRMHLSEGTWAMNVTPISTTTPAHWVDPKPARLIHFQHNREPEARIQDFEVLVADGLVTGTVAMPGGGAPPFTVTLALNNDEGIGRRTVITPGDLGTINLPMPSGTYKVWLRSADVDYMGPVVEPVQIPVNGTADLGTLTLLARDSIITGTVTGEGGTGVGGIPVTAWRNGAPGGDVTTTTPDGTYALSVVSGTWQVRPAPGPELPYLYTAGAETVAVGESETVPGIDFTVIETDAVLVGTLVDAGGTVLTDAEGWAAAHNTVTPTLHNGAPIDAGTFEIHLPAGTYNVAALLPTGSPYLSTGERRIALSSGATETLTLTLTEKNARIAGALWDPRNEDIVEDVDANVLAWDNGTWAATRVNTGNGTFRLDVAAGVWYLGYRVDPDSGYVGGLNHKNVPVAAGKIATVSLPVLERDGEISGEVLDPAGTPLAGATVIAEGAGPLVDALRFHTRTVGDGTFSLTVPHGAYHLGATIGVTDAIKPAMRHVVVPQDGASTGNILQFRLPDATISGTVTITGTQAITGAVKVWGWAEDDALVTTRVPVTASQGTYSLDVVSGTTWHLGAVYESPKAYWWGRTTVSLTTAGATADLTLRGPFPKPAPVAVTFDPTQPQWIALEDSTQILIPAGALPAAGPVTLHIVPIATLPRQRHANVYRYGYAFNVTDANGEPITDHFNQDVAITFTYTPAELWALGIPETQLKPAYFSTTTNTWTAPEGYVIDTAANRVVMQIDHFTDFALTYNAAAQLSAVFLPTVMR